MLPLGAAELADQADSTVELLGVQTDSLLGVQDPSTAELTGAQTEAEVLGDQTDSTGVEAATRLEGVHQVLV